VIGENPGDGHHTAKLQREIKNRTTETKTVIVLDDVDFLLLNDGDSLLYKISRTNPENTGIILTSSNTADLSEELEERTLSSLQPLRIGFEPYTAEQNFEILHQRAQKALKPRTLHENALSYITSTTQNTGKALTWLKTAATQNQSKINEDTVKEVREQASRNYAEQQLRYFTKHHQVLYQAIKELEDREPINTGQIYNQYQDLSDKPVSNRRISDFLKHIELLQLIKAEYHYGGKHGKTRDIQTNLI
jgi:Cdc6-like AAA superfamily ATPase